MIATFWNLVLVVLFTTLIREVEPSNAILAEMALAFAILVCEACSASWIAGLIVYPRLMQVADPSLAALFDPYIAWRSIHASPAMPYSIWTILVGVTKRKDAFMVDLGPSPSKTTINILSPNL